jgi:hypothetical protein
MTPFGKWLADGVVFVANKIDFDVSHSLNDTDLREFGLALGDRRRLLQAVAKLDGPLAADTVNPLVAAATAPRRCGFAGW